MKKTTALAAVLAAAFFIHAAEAADISIKVNGSPVDLSAYKGSEPYIENDRVMVPVRAVAEALGAEVSWNDKTSEVSVNDNIVLKINSNRAYINNEPTELDAPAVIKDSRTYIPLRFVSESLGAKVDWNNTERCVYISDAGISAEGTSDINTPAETASDQSENSDISKTTTVNEADSTAYFGGVKWSELAEKYKDSETVDSLIFVQYTGGSDAHVIMYEKSQESAYGWVPTVTCEAYVGSEGIGEGSEYSTATPIGDYGIITAFGIKGNPGTSLPYIDVTDDIYCCGDEEYYNTIINATELGHNCNGEHMASYVPQYNYGFFFDYNKERIFGKGSAFFFHCNGSKPYTAGCIAVDEDDMVRILQRMSMGTRLCIYAQ